MSLATRMRSTIPVLSKFLRSESSCTPLLRTYAVTSGKNEVKVKVPIALFGGSGNYASALYLAAVKANSLDKVESELFNLVEAIKKSPTFSQFTMDLSVPAETRVKAMNEISAEAKFADVVKNFLDKVESELFNLVEAIKKSPTFSQFTMDLSVPAETRVKAMNEISAEAKFADVVKNFLVVLAENGRLRYVDSIAKRFLELTMAHKGEVKAVVTTVIPIPPQEEKELKEALQDIIGQGKKVKLEQKIDPSILGGLVVEFGEKVFDMSIKTRARQLERFLRQPVSLDGL